MKKTLFIILGVGALGILLAEGIPQWFHLQWIGNENLRTVPTTEIRHFYTPAALADVRGTVIKVEQAVTKGPGMPEAVLLVRTEKDTVRVSLGPSWFVANQGFRFQPGDKVQASGAWIPLDNGKALYATEIRKEGKTLKLRDLDGSPLWER